MISTRFKRGAVKTHVFIRNTFKNYNTPQVKSSVKFARTCTLTFVALRMVTLPIPMATPAYAAGTDGLDTEPPSTQRIDDSVIDAITFSPSPDAAVVQPLGVAADSFTSISVGKSIATAEDEQKKAADAAAKNAAATKAASVKSSFEKISFSGNGCQLVYDAAVAAFGAEEAQAAVLIAQRESGCNPNSYNASSGACGIWQALPCTKMGGTELSNQIQWGLKYIKARYGSPNNAWAFWQRNHWY